MALVGFTREMKGPAAAFPLSAAPRRPQAMAGERFSPPLTGTIIRFSLAWGPSLFTEHHSGRALVGPHAGLAAQGAGADERTGPELELAPVAGGWIAGRGPVSSVHARVSSKAAAWASASR
jgi:hypothetical protein